MLASNLKTESASDEAGSSVYLEESLLNFHQVSELVRLSRSCIYNLIKDGKFPKPLKITKYASRWKKSEILDWIDSLPRMDGAI
jgi:prophage regulatory protein